MLKKKLLISYYSVLITIFIFSLLSLISSCSYRYLYTPDINSYTNLIYVDTLSNDYGMFMTSQLRCYFPNTNYSEVKYILKVNIKIKEKLQLDDKYGFSTQGELWIISNWQILDKNTGKDYISSSDIYPAFYNIMSSGYATINNKEHTINLALKSLTKNISLKITGLLKKYDGELSNLK